MRVLRGVADAGTALPQKLKSPQDCGAQCVSGVIIRSDAISERSGAWWSNFPEARKIAVIENKSLARKAKPTQCPQRACRSNSSSFVGAQPIRLRAYFCQNGMFESGSFFGGDIVAEYTGIELPEVYAK